MPASSSKRKKKKKWLLHFVIPYDKKKSSESYSLPFFRPLLNVCLGCGIKNWRDKTTAIKEKKCNERNDDLLLLPLIVVVIVCVRQELVTFYCPHD